MFGEIYQHDANSNYLVIKGIQEEYKDFSDIILQENQIPGLLSCQYRLVDGQICFYYKVSSLQSLSHLFEKRKIGWEELAHILREIGKNWREIESYLINQEKIVLLPEYIFTDFDLEKIYFCYYPDYENVFSYERLATFFIDKVDYKDNKAVELAYGFHGQMSEVNSSFSDVVSRLLTGNEKKEEPEMSEYIVEDYAWKEEKDIEVKEKEIHFRGLSPQWIGIGMIVLVAEAIFFLGLKILMIYQGILLMVITVAIFLYCIWNQRKKENLEKENYEISLTDEEDVSEKTEYSFAEPVGQTVFLSKDIEMEQHSLIYQGKDNLKDFVLNVYPFVIGKAEKGIDGTIFIPEISRIHCQINYENQEYMLQDLNSTNGTYLNGCLLEPREQMKLQPGDRIVLANQPFLFQ